MKHVFFLVLLFSSFCSSSFNGQLDPTFGRNGTIMTNYDKVDDMAASIDLQSDGKIIVAGSTGGSLSWAFSVARYDQNGAPDFSFTSGQYPGLVITDFGFPENLSFCQSVKVQKDDKIVAAGLFGFSNPSFAVARYTVNGKPDTSFNKTGYVLTNFGGDSDSASALAIHDNGKILVVGNTDRKGYNCFALVRYNTDGSLDTSFNKAGTVITDLGQDAIPTSVVIQNDDKIVVAGYTKSKFIIVRYQYDGQLDKSFNSSGIVMGSFGGAADAAYGIALQFSGKRIIIAGTGNAFGKNVFALAAFTEWGILDTSFNAGQGIIIIPFSKNIDVAKGIAIQDDEKIVSAGYATWSSSQSEFAVARCAQNGTLDTSFNPGQFAGTVLTNFTIPAQASSLVIQPNGRIIVAGTATQDPDNFAYFALARYIAQNNTQEQM